MPRYSLAARVNAAKRFHLAVEVVPGAESRGSASYAPGCYVGHNTAGAKTGDRPSLKLCTDGRADLDGPLCEDFLPRRGGLVIVACGRSNNAGLGGFRGIVGNSGTMACEAEDDGDGKWTDEQYRDYPRIVASGLWLMNRDASWYCSHRTWALVPPSWPNRKVDPVGISDEWMRAWVDVLLKYPDVVPHAGMPGTTATTPKGTFVTLSAAQEKKIVDAADAILGMTAPGKANAADTLAAILPNVQALANLVNRNDSALAAAIGDGKSAVLSYLASMPTAELTEAERHALALEISTVISEHGMPVDNAAISAALASDLAARLTN